MRPSRKHGGARATTSLEEAALWRRAMESFHGEDWRIDLETQSIEDVKKLRAFEKQALLEAVEPSGFSPGTSPVAEPAGSAPDAQGAGVGNVFALSEEAQSERTSSTLSNPGTPRGLQKMLKRPYDPLEDTYERYAKRVHRLIAALDMANIRTDEKWWGPMLWDAEITSKIHPLKDEQQVAWLKRAFADHLMTEDMRGEEEREWRIEVINRRLAERGYRSPARYVDKIASGSPESYLGSPFQFDIKGVSLPREVPQMPVILGKNLKRDENEGVITPRRRLELGSQSPSIAGSAQAQAQVGTVRLESSEQAAQHYSLESAVVTALNRQTELMDKVFNKPVEGRRGVIRIEPKVQWPVLNSDDLEVEEFYEEFETFADRPTT